MTYLRTLSIALLFLSTISFSQEEKDDFGNIREAIFNFHHISVELNSTFNKTRYEMLTGSDVPNDPYLWMPSMDLKYSFDFGMPFAIRLKTGFGAHGYRWDVDPKYGYGGTDSSAWIPMTYGGMAYASIGYEHRFFIGKRWMLNCGIDAGLTLFSIGELFVEYAPHGFEFDLDWEDSHNENVSAKPMLSAQVGIDRITRSKNTLGIYIIYNHYPAESITGSYSLYGGTSTGRVWNRNSNLGFGINYTFTRARRY